MTAHYRKLSILYAFLSELCMFGPIAFYFIRAFAFGDAVQKWTLGVVFTAVFVLTVLNFLMKLHLRSIVWLFLLGLFTVFSNFIAVIAVFAVTTFMDELIFSPLHKKYASKAFVQHEMDKRIGEK